MPDKLQRVEREQQLLRHARREGLVIMAVWAASLAWSAGYAALFGYRQPPGSVRIVWGFPSWVLWSVVVPWGLCLIFTVWFCFFFMADDDLGEDRDEGAPHG